MFCDRVTIDVSEGSRGCRVWCTGSVGNVEGRLTLVLYCSVRDEPEGCSLLGEQRTKQTLRHSANFILQKDKRPTETGVCSPAREYIYLSSSPSFALQCLHNTHQFLPNHNGNFLQCRYEIYMLIYWNTLQNFLSTINHYYEDKFYPKMSLLSLSVHSLEAGIFSHIL